MAKRFTDTEKWKRPWFGDLPNLGKLTWVYILDDCDHRGVWVANFKRLSFDLGSRVSQDRFQKWFGDKVIRIEEDKYFIPSFVEFQYGEELSASNRAHRGILQLMERHRDAIESARISDEAPNQSDEATSQNEGVSKGLGSPMEGDKDTEKEKEKDKEKEPRERDFEILWQAYPRKISKTDARVRFSRLIRSNEDFADLQTAIANYAEYLRAHNTEEKYIKHFSSFLGTEEKQSWRDWVELEATPLIDGPDLDSIFGNNPEDDLP